MTEVEFKRVVKCAKKADYPNTDQFRRGAESALMGFAIPRKRGDWLFCTVEQAAYVFNYQCLMLNGEYDTVAVADLHIGYRKNVKLI